MALMADDEYQGFSVCAQYDEYLLVQHAGCDVTEGTEALGFIVEVPDLLALIRDHLVRVHSAVPGEVFADRREDLAKDDEAANG